ncbi:MAG: DNA repair protein RadC [Saprospiraceae bacterium]|nr:DNA repair protein RadC [Saprospiraceae bacterium]
MKQKPNSILPIKSWAKDDQPRYKMKHKGRDTLSDSELLAILIGSGTQEMTALDVCKAILSSVNGDLENLARLSLGELMKFKGIGEAKAITIAAALELGRRRQGKDNDQRMAITSSRSAFEVLAPNLMDKVHEEFWVLYLNRANQILLRSCVSSGGVSGTFVDPRIIYTKAVELLASSIILCHNHPSGQLKPSQQDISLTKKIKEAGQVLDIAVLDHIIVANQRYFSFADEGLM